MANIWVNIIDGSSLESPKTYSRDTSLVVQWLGFRASTAGGVGSIPGWGSCMPSGMAKKKKFVFDS